MFFLPRSLFFYICGGGRSALYDQRRVTREEGTTSFSLALLNLPFLLSSSKRENGERTSALRLSSAGTKQKNEAKKRSL